MEGNYPHQSPEYERFSSYVERMSSSDKNEEFHVKLRILSTVDVPSNLYRTNFLSLQDLQIKSSALKLSKMRSDKKYWYNTVFAYQDRLVKCQIENRSPSSIFSGLSEIFVTGYPVPVYCCQKDSRRRWTICKYLGERHAFFYLNKYSNELELYRLCLKIKHKNVSFHAKNCKCRSCIPISQ